MERPPTLVYEGGDTKSLLGSGRVVATVAMGVIVIMCGVVAFGSAGCGCSGVAM